MSHVLSIHAHIHLIHRNTTHTNETHTLDTHTHSLDTQKHLQTHVGPKDRSAPTQPAHTHTRTPTHTRARTHTHVNASPFYDYIQRLR